MRIAKRRSPPFDMEGERTAAQREHVQLFLRAFQFYLGRDIEGLLELIDPDVEVTAPQWMNAGPFHGHAGYMAWISQWNEAWQELDFDVVSVEPVGERHVVGEVLTRGRGVESGVEVEQTAGWMVEMRNRRAAYVEVTVGVESALEVARRRERLGA